MCAIFLKNLFFLSTDRNYCEIIGILFPRDGGYYTINLFGAQDRSPYLLWNINYNGFFAVFENLQGVWMRKIFV